MARRPEPDLPLSRDELAQLKKQFDTMTESSLQTFYHEAYRRCQYVYKAPTARSMQELVAIWKYLRGRNRRQSA